MLNSLSSFYEEETKTWCGPEESLYYDLNCSVGRVIFHAMRNYPKNICQISAADGKTMTNQEVLTLAIRIAQHYKKLGMGCDDIVGVVGSNSEYAISAIIACYLHCTPVHVVNPKSDEPTLSHIFGLTKPKVIFCDGGNYEKTRSATETFQPLIYTLKDRTEGVASVEDLLKPTKTEAFYRPQPLTKGPNQTMIILCSSGTTGKPKGVCMSNHKLLVFTEFLTNEDVIYTSSTLDWLSGAYALLLSSMFGCTLLVSNEPYSPEYFVELVRKYKVSYAMLSPRNLGPLIDCPTATVDNLSSLRFVSLGGCRPSLTQLQRTQEILKNAHISNGYGMTEVTGVSVNVGLEKGHSVGKLLPGIRVRIVDEDGGSLGPNEVGEVFVHDRRVWNGYYGNPTATQELQDINGWFHTGDLGYFDADNYLYIVDRKKDILKYQGWHYWPAEIEQVIAELPQVVDVCVVGITDFENGDAPGAIIVTANNTKLTEQEVKDHVAGRFKVFYKELHAGVRFVEQLPHNANGKLLRNKATELFVHTLN